MATRLYFDSTFDYAAVPIPFGTEWDSTVVAIRRRLNRTKQSSVMTTTASVTSTSNASEFHLIAQFLLPGLAKQRLSGVFKGQVRGSENAASMNALLAVRVAKCNSLGQNIVEITNYIKFPTAYGNNQEFVVTTLTNRVMNGRNADVDYPNSSPISFADVLIDDGDMLIVELGIHDYSAGTSDTARLSIGDDSATDLAEDTTTTTADNPWIEFSQTIAFLDQATRFYFDSAVEPDIAPAFGSDWDNLDSRNVPLRRRLNRTPQLSPMVHYANVPTALNPEHHLMYQFVLPNLAPQVLSGSFRGQIKGTEGGSSANCQAAIRLAKCNADGSNVVEITTIQASTSASTPPEFAGGSIGTNRSFSATTATGAPAYQIVFPGVQINYGDALIVEVGILDQSAGLPGTGTGTLIVGDDSGNDLPDDDLTAIEDDNPWIEFAQEVLLLDDLPVALPIADVSAGNWVPSYGSRLFSMLNDVPEEDNVLIPSFVLLGGLNSTTDGTSFAETVPYTPTPGKLLLLLAHVSGDQTDPLSVVGHNVTWDRITADAPNLGTDGRMFAYAGIAPANADSSALTWTFSTTQTGITFQVVEVTNADVSGTARAAVVQTTTAVVTAATQLTNLPFSLPKHSANRQIAFIVHEAAESTAGTAVPWVEIYDASRTSPSVTVQIQKNESLFDRNGFTATWTTSSNARAVGLEIQAAIPATVLDTDEILSDASLSDDVSIIDFGKLHVSTSGVFDIEIRHRSPHG
jgi:hypothetical protein